jgi:mono/diheme cytochrome c family protein
MRAKRVLPLVGLFAVAVFLSAIWTVQGAGRQEPRLVYRPYDVGEVDFGTPVPATPEVIKAGEKLFMANCARCHGPEGKGDGSIAYLMSPMPRDFTRGVYKLRSTPSGQLPTDENLFRTITLGMPGSGMPPWKGKLTAPERWQIVRYLKTLYPQWEEDVKTEALRPITMPKTLPASARSLARGKELYQTMKCWECHGQTGKADGPKSDQLVDDWGNQLAPGDLSRPWFFRGGAQPEDVYRTFVTGVDGTPMPSFADSIPNEADRWHLVNFVLSLAEGKPPEPVLVEANKGATSGLRAFEQTARLGSAAGKPEVVIDVVASGWEMWIMQNGTYLPRVEGTAQAGHEIRVKKGQVVQVNFWPTENGLGSPYGHGFSIEGYDDVLFGVHAAGGPTAGSGAAYIERPLAYRFVADRAGEFPFYCAVQCDPGQPDFIKKLTGLWGHTFMGGTFIVE